VGVFAFIFTIANNTSTYIGYRHSASEADRRTHVAALGIPLLLPLSLSTFFGYHQL
jgi:hypothetical protein